MDVYHQHVCYWFTSASWVSETCEWTLSFTFCCLIAETHSKTHLESPAFQVCDSLTKSKINPARSFIFLLCQLSSVHWVNSIITDWESSFAILTLEGNGQPCAMQGWEAAGFLPNQSLRQLISQITSLSLVFLGKNEHLVTSWAAWLASAAHGCFTPPKRSCCVLLVWGRCRLTHRPFETLSFPKVICVLCQCGCWRAACWEEAC